MALSVTRLPEPPRSQSASRALPILFCALAVSIAMLLLVLLKFDVLGAPAMIFWKSSRPGERFFLAVGAPYSLAMLLLLIPNTHARAFASGIASVAAGVFIFWEGVFFIVLLIAMIFESSPSMRSAGPRPGPIALFIFFSLICHITACLSSVVLGTRGLPRVPAFLLGAILAGGYAHAVYARQQSSQANYIKSVEDVDKESTAAFITIESISWCAIEYASQHSGQAYPASLALITDNPICKRSWSVSAIPDYVITYIASADSSGKVVAFSVKAVASPNPLRAPKNAGSDQSGVAVIQYLDPHDNRYPAEVGTTSPLDTIRWNKFCFRNYAADHNQLGFPRNFADVPNCYNGFKQYGGSFQSDTVVRRDPYLFTYSPAAPDRAGRTNSYQLQTTCQSYGTSCLHSFLLTDNGDIFFTAANRPATPHDTLLPPCSHLYPVTTFCIQEE
jgi:hypothetical protein